MFKRIDADNNIKFEGYSYLDKNGNEESVRMHYESTEHRYVEITNSAQEKVIFYKEDIPNLIKALQAAYDH